MFLADLGYQGCYHCFVPCKGNKVFSSTEKKVNKCLSKIRSRVERHFTFLDQFRFFWGTDHDLSWVKDAVQIVLVLMYGSLCVNPQH